MYRLPNIPEYITVHIGEDLESDNNINVSFVEYIKNVASGEIYPNWPEEAIKANVYAIISFTLNRIYNEWYRSQGYNFDITSSSKYDQSFQENRQFFENIFVIVDQIFNEYIVRDGQVQPLFAAYCDGKNTKCEGLSQWGSATLANQGLDALQILKRYYGNDIKIVNSDNISNVDESFPGYEIVLGDAGNYIKQVKTELNRIGRNYPAIPIIIDDSVYFNVEMLDAVKKFQEIFNLPVTGNIDFATWYKIKYVFNAVKNISSVYSEGIHLEEVELKYPMLLNEGDSGIYIRDLNYYLNAISYFNPEIPYRLEGDVFSKNTKDDVLAFQRINNLEETGYVDAETWKYIKTVYNDYINSTPSKCFYNRNEFFPGRYLSFGMEGADVLNLQRFLYLICNDSHDISGVVVSGEFDSLTRKSIIELQNKFGLNPTGVVTAETWRLIVEEANKS